MLLKSLCEAFGPSGFETDVRNVIREAITPSVDSVYTDVLGNLIAERGADRSGPRVLLDAHMDEVGLMIVGAEASGLLRFRTLGGIDPRVLVSKQVTVGERRLVGVIGSKPIHLQSADERTKPIPLEGLYIDIGATSKAEALSHVSIGEAAVFRTAYEEIGRRVKAKSLDDRAGCAMLVEVLKEPVHLPLYAAFTVQEEIGLRGATVAAHRIQPDIAIALESTVCFDVVGAPSHGQGTRLGHGPALTIHDSQTIANRRFLAFMQSVAEKHGIPVQIRRIRGGSNDFGAIHKTREGVVGGGISIPTRYIHAPSQIASLDDYENAIRLVRCILQELASGGWSA